MWARDQHRATECHCHGLFSKTRHRQPLPSAAAAAGAAAAYRAIVLQRAECKLASSRIKEEICFRLADEGSAADTSDSRQMLEECMKLALSAWAEVAVLLPPRALDCPLVHDRISSVQSQLAVAMANPAP
ncbi:hypothetical protein MUK42_12393 [Musa troglodytarum]|uniref:Uncharacterized protein n=1 Tax=Musa troglodytarum TaxID=320322 RepID=A0A9E7JVB5_9LILI|nr:hypothetical protein MUK42_12393 [Musa troglodytarum]